MLWTDTQLPLDCRAAVLKFSSHRGVVELGQDRMADRMCANRNQWVRGQRRKLAPVHTQGCAEGFYIDPMTDRQFPDGTAQFILGFETPQPSINLVEGL